MVKDSTLITNFGSVFFFRYIIINLATGTAAIHVVKLKDAGECHAGQGGGIRPTYLLTAFLVLDN